MSPRLAAGTLALVCVATLVGCGGAAERPEGSAPGTPGTVAPTAAPSAPPSGAAGPSPSGALEGRGPVLEVKGTEYHHTVRVVDAVVSPNAPGNPAPSGRTYIQLVLKVAALEPGRAIRVPSPKLWGVEFEGCRAAQDKDTRISCGLLDEGSNYYTAADMNSDEFGPGVGMFGTLEADTVYYARAWQLVPEAADLSKATLCQTTIRKVPDNCIPLGEVRKAADPKLPGA
ncbi:hypothetical protein [Streptomyces sp. NBC_01408]|uniref:hypothetical protein n=1 Tax=Streptomyces sp. NBC_01408 TaxID=2903855 RepID=UPI00225618B0|nr:hypothetical protein [Streptomyces sp. NBC_01408]MCX4692570.1 hypothetical protein [Streptomyces sp. NBC_01408]